MITVIIPDYEAICGYDDLKEIPRSKEGVYVLMDEKDNPLYVGKSNDIQARARDHFTGNSNTSRFYTLIEKIAYFEEKDPVLRDMYETYLINKLQSRWNMGKCYTFESYYYKYRVKKPSRWDRKHYKDKERCTALNQTGVRCKQIASEDGLCKRHLKTEGVVRWKP